MTTKSVDVASAEHQENRAETRTSKRVSLAALRPLVPMALKYKGRVAAALLALTAASVATLAIPIAVRRMIDFGFNAASTQLIDAYFVALVAIVAVLALASGSRFYFVMTLGERVVADLRDAVFRHLTTLDAAFYDTARVGELLSVLSADTTQIKAAFGASASVALRNIFMFVGSVALMALTSVKLSGFVLLAIPVIVLPLVAAGRSVRKRSRAAQDRLAEATAFAGESIGAVRTMQAFGAERQAADSFKAAADAAFMGSRDAAKARAVLTIVALFLAFSSVVGVLWLGAQDVLAGRISAGSLSQFVIYAVLGASSLGQLSDVWSELSAAAGAAERIAELLRLRSSITAPPHPKPLPRPARGEVVFERVSFLYPTRPHDEVVRDLSLAVHPGQTVAIVGPSGAGKSTVFQLLARFYDVSAGHIMVDGIDVRDVDPAELRARLAMVPQDPVVFGISVADNIRYGHPEATEAQVRAAAERAAADGFIRSMPKGYETRVGERGVTLSGGQRQRIAIARAILKDAPILLLDEATSALDAENESAVQAALEELMRERTTIVVAHRLATVLSADRILVMDDGRIVEDGIYERLARLQFEIGAAALAPEHATG